MQLIEFGGHGVRRFAIFWGALTAVYAASVLYRLLALHQPLSLPTFAAFSAILAVWFEAYAIFTPHIGLQLGVIISLVTSVALNIAEITQSLKHDKVALLTRTVFTLLLLLVLASKTHAFLMRRTTHKVEE